MYNWQQKDWKLFKFQQEKLEDLLLTFTEKLGLAKGLLQSLSEMSHTESLIDLLVTETIKNAEIEGEYLVLQEIHCTLPGIGATVLNKETVLIIDKEHPLYNDIPHYYKNNIIKKL